MTGNTPRVAGSAEILRIAGDDAYTRMMLPDAAVGYVFGGTVAWLSAVPWQSPVLCLRGNPFGAALLLDELRRADLIPDGTWLRLPITSEPDSVDGLRTRLLGRWLFLSRSDIPVPTGQDSAVEPLSDADDIAALLNRANPESPANPSAPGIRRWFGIYRRTGSSRRSSGIVT